MNSLAVEKRAKQLFDSGFYCAESVLQAVAEHAATHSPLIPKISTGFCGGISRSKGMCGAVTGGVMALGMIFGRTSADMPPDDTYLKVRELLTTFENQYGSSNCFDLTGCDFNEAMGRERWKESGMANKCREFTGAAARMVVEIIDGGVAEQAKA
ncbi:MAG: C-GCAxxG-C-C family protein [Desulfomonilaceae bacterium]|jgi:C_GCAxxG_C_C family probable redox protein